MSCCGLSNNVSASCRFIVAAEITEAQQADIDDLTGPTSQAGRAGQRLVSAPLSAADRPEAPPDARMRAEHIQQGQAVPTLWNSPLTEQRRESGVFG